MIRDGRTESGVSLELWAEGRCDPPFAGLLPKMARRLGTSVPPLSDVAGSEHAVPARVDWGRWCVDCPCGAASMVWLEGPHQMWCGACGNRAVDGKWRPVTVPADWAAINAALDGLEARDQNWRPDGAGA